MYKPGDLVKLYAPPNQDQLQKRGRRRSHALCWRGPALITSEDRGMYTVDFEGRTFERNIKTVSLWKAGDTEFGFEGLDNSDLLSESKVGDIIACRSELDKDEFWLAKVLKVHEDKLHVQFFGTRNRNIKNAIFTPLFRKDQELMFGIGPKQANSPAGAQVYTGDLYNRKFPDVVILPKVTLLPSGKLNSKSRKALRVRGYTHHKM